MRYIKLAEIYEQLFSTTKLLEKTDILAGFLKKIPAGELEEVMLLIRGRVFPEWDNREIGIGVKLVIKAIASAAGLSAKDVEQKWKEIGDLGEVAQNLLSQKKQLTLFQKSLTTKKVLENMQKIASLEGAGTIDRKISLLKELLSHAEPVSAKYIVRTCLEELRIGVGSGLVRDAIAKAFNVPKELVQCAYDLTTDFGYVARVVKEKGIAGLKKVKITPGKPLKVMLSQRVKDIEEGFSRVGKPAAIEYKYDGFRMQIHKIGDKILIFTRRLERVTDQFPDVVNAIKKSIKADKCVIEGETIGIHPKTHKWLPFQKISQRIKRKYDIEEMAKRIPVMINLFDILYLNGKNLIDTPFKKRRELLKKIIKPIPEKVELAKQLVTDDREQAKKFYKEALKKGNEGIMMKNLGAPYKPGSRVGYMVKLKPTMESLDLVIVGAEWGTGKRATWLSSFVLACRDPETGKFLTIGKMGTGVKEKSEEGVSFKQLTKLLKPLIVSEKGKSVEVKPEIVVEVAYEEIQKSPTYESGFALRFPRLVGLRYDRGPEEANTIEKVKELFKSQKKR